VPEDLHGHTRWTSRASRMPQVMQVPSTVIHRTSA
jgi:hypothetical protein